MNVVLICHFHYSKHSISLLCFPLSLVSEPIVSSVEIKATCTMKSRRRISWEEINESWLNGLCVFCKEPEAPDHHLKHKNLGLLMIYGNDDHLSNGGIGESIDHRSMNLVHEEREEHSKLDNHKDLVQRTIMEEREEHSNSEILKSVEPREVNFGLENLDSVVMNEYQEQDWVKQNMNKRFEVEDDVDRGQKLLSITENCSAHQVFGKTSQHEEKLEIKKKAKGFKSWMFKFKLAKKTIRKRDNKGWFHTWSRKVGWRKNKSMKLQFVSHQVKESSHRNKDSFAGKKSIKQEMCVEVESLLQQQDLRRIKETQADQGDSYVVVRKLLPHLESVCATKSFLDNDSMSELEAELTDSKMRTAGVTQHQDQQPIVTEALRLISNDFHSDVAELCEQLTCDESHKPKQRLSPKSWMFKYRRDHKILHSPTMSRNVRMVVFRKMEAAERSQHLVTHRFHVGPLEMDTQDSEIGIIEVLRRVMMLFQNSIVQAKMMVTKRKKTFYKSRRFKFKHRVVPRALQYGFEVKMKQKVSTEYPCLFLIGKEAELVHILLGDERFQIKHTWRTKFIHSVSSIGVGHYEYSIWTQSDKGTQLFYSRRLVVYKLGSEAKNVVEVSQRVYQLVKLKFAKDERKLEVIQSQTFDPGIGIESQELLENTYSN
ncbi:hypothetical protein AXX17_AT4G17520 [Arabidopsis thaliana]|uniref:Uncharacterized protein n=1 Tax=Arabidopsis thaliana TaxID=3702 RepID=A0A178USJ7_ARATH|nr:hypothetical protein AXX17_AT4G17520 [Arabidopsis thaliana]